MLQCLQWTDHDQLPFPYEERQRFEDRQDVLSLLMLDSARAAAMVGVMVVEGLIKVVGCTTGFPDDGGEDRLVGGSCPRSRCGRRSVRGVPFVTWMST